MQVLLVLHHVFDHFVHGVLGLARLILAVIDLLINRVSRHERFSVRYVLDIWIHTTGPVREPLDRTVLVVHVVVRHINTDHAVAWVRAVLEAVAIACVATLKALSRLCRGLLGWLSDLVDEVPNKRSALCG